MFQTAALHVDVIVQMLQQKIINELSKKSVSNIFADI